MVAAQVPPRVPPPRGPAAGQEREGKIGGGVPGSRRADARRLLGVGEQLKASVAGVFEQTSTLYRRASVASSGTAATGSDQPR